jgi:hypothetical protein
MGIPELDLTPYYVLMAVIAVVGSVPALAFCWICNRFFNVLDRKWQRDAERDTVKADADRLNRPFTNR